MPGPGECYPHDARPLTGALYWPSKMDCPATRIPADTCKTGAKLAETSGTVCEMCYAMKGTFRSANVQKKFKAAYESLFHPKWVPAMIALVRWHADERFRWFVSGDLQSVNHLRNIIRVCLETPEVCHWLPTSEYATVRACEDGIPDNLTVRVSGNLIDGPAPTWWKTTSTVVNDPNEATCPSSKKGGNCGDHGCKACWDRGVKTVKYLWP